MADASHLSVHLRQSSPISLAADFDCQAGELLALVGPSGSGKSTILRLIAGLNQPHEGIVRSQEQIWLDTTSGISRPPQMRSVGFVFQNYVLFPHLTALENVALSLQNSPADVRKERAHQLLEMVHLQGLENRLPSALSGGQQQRVALARALARDPDVLLLDEPFSAVDQVTRRKLQRELARLREQLHLPIILVTHDLEEACLLADRMCLLHRGQTLQTGAPLDVLARPANAQVARLVGLTNIFQAIVERHDSRQKQSWIRWHGQLLSCQFSSEFAIGETVDWVIPPQHVMLHQRVRPSRGERENPVSGIIDELVVLGETASISLNIDHHTETPLAMTLPVHVVNRNVLRKDENISVSLLSEAIHLMPRNNANTG